MKEVENYSVFGIHLGQNRDGKQGRLGILLSLTVIKSAVMEPFTFSTVVTIILMGALTRVGELSLDGAIAQLKNLIAAKSPETWKQLEATANNPAALPETIEVMATLLEDQELREVAEKVTKENESNPYVIQMINQNKQITVNQSGHHNTQNNSFNL